VAGLVLVDPTHPDLPTRFVEQFGTRLEPPTAVLRIGQALSTVGLLRVAIVNGAFPQIPESLWRDVAAYAGQSLPAILDETANFAESLREAGTVRSLGDRPLVVLTAMAPLSDGDLAALKLTAEDGSRFRALLQELHRNQTSWSTRGRHVPVSDAGHYIQFDKPGAVVTAVREVIAEVRLSRTQ
jgi:pimeloyl-ACP methyl ester carboxylesterase